MSVELPTTVRIAIERVLAPHQHEYAILPLIESLRQYRDEGWPVGDFLRALLSNDLLEAVGRADHHNIWLLPIYVGFLYNEMPSPAWGSREKVDAWLAQHQARRANKGSALSAPEVGS